MLAAENPYSTSTWRTPPPELGADSRQVLVEYGFSAARIDALVAAGIVQCK